MHAAEVVADRVPIAEAHDGATRHEVGDDRADRSGVGYGPADQEREGAAAQATTAQPGPEGEQARGGQCIAARMAPIAAKRTA